MYPDTYSKYGVPVGLYWHAVHDDLRAQLDAKQATGSELPV